MSIQTMNRVWSSSQQKGSALLLLLAIADNANDAGEAFPGIAYLAHKTRMSERQVQRLIQYLAATDELAVIFSNGRGYANYYYVLVDRPTSDIRRIKAACERRNQANQAAKKGDILSPFPEQKGDIQGQKGDIFDGKGDIFDGKGDIAMSPQPINQLTIKNQEDIDPGENEEFPLPEPEPDLGPIPWQFVLDQVKYEMSRRDYERYAVPLQLLAVENGVARVRAPDEARAAWARSRLSRQIARLLGVGSVEFVIPEGEKV